MVHHHRHGREGMMVCAIPWVLGDRDGSRSFHLTRQWPSGNCEAVVTARRSIVAALRLALP